MKDDPSLHRLVARVKVNYSAKLEIMFLAEVRVRNCFVVHPRLTYRTSVTFFFLISFDCATLCRLVRPFNQLYITEKGFSQVMCKEQNVSQNNKMSN